MFGFEFTIDDIEEVIQSLNPYKPILMHKMINIHLLK